MFGTVGRVAVLTRAVAIAFMLYVVTYIAVQIGAGIEAQRARELRELDQSIQPVQLLVLDHRECLGDSFIVSGLLNKTKYPNGKEAEIQAMLIYSVGEPGKPPRLYEWRRTDADTDKLISRRYGEQSIDFIIEGPCDMAFTVDTRHESPLTGDIRPMRWGPFEPER